MAAFEKILSGIPGMDHALNHIRLGDNVVWQVSTLEEFSYFVDPYVKQAIKDKRNLIYIRFASHPPLVEEQEGVRVIRVELSHRFETFTMNIHHIVEQEGQDAFYVFDCLSELQMAWATDLMMGNFFRVTCPFLFQLDTVAFFPVIRGRHSNEAIAKIRDTTQLLLDVYSQNDTVYVHPLKVWNRYTPTMFLPHVFYPATGEYHEIKDGVEVGQYYALVNDLQMLEADTQIDSWDRFFHNAKLQQEAGVLPDESLSFMCSIMMTRDERLRQLVKKYFGAKDYFFVRNRMIGTGMIGGKACGMLLARKIAEHKMPDYQQYMEPHDSYFIGSDVFYTFLVDNGCWDLRIRQRSPEEYFSVAPQLQKEIERGEFPSAIREQFRKLLDYFGRSPIIVRSSSILEDGFGNAFAGKYESVFCVNGGSPEERLQAFEDAVRRVYMSTMDQSALEYRYQRNLQNRDEQMAILVQRVSGSYFGPYFMPDAAGVGFSYSAYRFMRDMDPAKGMLRLVAGLGTKAVDRTQGDYPSLISLDKPKAYARPSVAERHRYSQRKLDTIDTENNVMQELRLEQMLEYLPQTHKNMVLEHDTEAESSLRARGIYRDSYFISCRGLANNTLFISMMKQLLHVLQVSYGKPVDIEYTVNLGKDGSFVVNLLQCRPLQVCTEDTRVRLPEVQEEQKLLHIRHSCMGNPREVSVDAIVMVDPFSYYSLPYNQKSNVARTIGALNAYFKAQKKNMVLIVPGRIGTSSPELGVPVTFADISSCEAIFEVSYSEVGYTPELSFGSHMFQDLVEAEIFYGAVLEDASRIAYHPELLRSMENHFTTLCPDAPQEDNNLIHVSLFETGEVALCYDMIQEEAMLYFTKKT